MPKIESKRTRDAEKRRCDEAASAAAAEMQKRERERERAVEIDINQLEIDYEDWMTGQPSNDSGY
jgi:hypothetical protein